MKSCEVERFNSFCSFMITGKALLCILLHVFPNFFMHNISFYKTMKPSSLYKTYTYSETCLIRSPMGHNFMTILSRWLYYKGCLYVNDTFWDFVVGWFKQVTLLHSDLIRQVSLYIRIYTFIWYILTYMYVCSCGLSVAIIACLMLVYVICVYISLYCMQWWL